MRSLPLKGAISDDQLEIIIDGGVLVENGIIKAVDTFSKLKSEVDSSDIDYLEKPTVGLPGLIDAHTHICWAGSRAKDYALRVSGKTYTEILKEGGGIYETVEKTRASSEDNLVDLIEKRAKTHLQNGITTIEVKSGYGLSLESEIKCLNAIKRANQTVSSDLIPTCLAAHVPAKEFNNAVEYLHYVENEILPQVQEKELANRVDIFVEDGAFSVENSKSFLHSVKEKGFDITVHADQFTSGGSKLAVEVGALSADHLEASSEKDIEFLSQSSVVANVLPGASLGLGIPFAPARQVLDKGGILAISTDWNPGSAPMGDLLTQAALLSAYQKLSAAETFSAITFRAAKALKLSDRGILNPGFLGDIVGFPTNDFREILYQQGQMKPYIIWKNGTKQ